MNYGGGMWEGGGWAGWSGVGVGKWDNCNSIINKYIKKNNVFLFGIYLRVVQAVPDL